MADETFELYALTSKLTLDTSQFDRAYGASRAKMTTLQGDLQKLETQSGTTGKTIDSGMGGPLDSLAARFGLATGAAGAFTSGIAIGIGIYVAAGKAIFELADSVATAQGKFHDLSNETNFSVEFLSGLSPLAIAAGKDVDDLSASLVIFQKNLVKGGEAFDVLGITSKNNEEALKQAAKGLFNVKDGAQQTALAMEIFGRSGRAMLAVIKDNNGDLEAAQKFWRKWGLAISAETAAAADDFGDGMDRIGLRLTGIRNQIGQEAIPAFNALFTSIEAALDANQTNWKWWGEQVAKVILTVGTVMGGFASAISKFDPWNPLAAGKFIQDFYEGMNKTADAVVADYWKRTHPTMSMPDIDTSSGIFRKDWNPGEKKTKTKAGRDPARDEATSRDMRVRNMLAEYDAEESDLKRSLERRAVDYEEYVIKAQLLESKRSQGIIAGLIEEAKAIEKMKDGREKELANQELGNKRLAEQRRHKEALARIDDDQIERTRRLADMVTAFSKAQADQLRTAQGGSKTALDAVKAFIEEFEKAGGKLTAQQKFWLEFDAMLIRVANTADRLKNSLKDIADNTPPIASGTIPPLTDAQKKGNVLTPDDLRKLGEPPPEDPGAKWRRLADDLSYDITYTIDNAIRAGFEDGIGAGVAEFGRGILAMAKHEALDFLRRAMRDALGGGGGSESGGDSGGIFKTLISFGLKAVAGLFGGGSGSAGGIGAAMGAGMKAGGGYVSPGQMYFAGDRGTELIKAGPHGDTVYPHGQSMDMLAMAGAGGQQINIYAQDVRGAYSRETVTQARRRLQRLQRGR